jgi:hypothetical protein
VVARAFHDVVQRRGSPFRVSPSRATSTTFGSLHVRVPVLRGPHCSGLYCAPPGGETHIGEDLKHSSYRRNLKRNASALTPAPPHDTTVRMWRPGLIRAVT